MEKNNSIEERQKELLATGLCNTFDFRPESRTRIENYTFDFPVDHEGRRLLNHAVTTLELVDAQLERLERIVKAILKLGHKTTAESCHIAEAVQYVADV